MAIQNILSNSQYTFLGPTKLDFLCNSLKIKFIFQTKKQTGPSVLSVPISSQTSQKYISSFYLDSSKHEIWSKSNIYS